MYVFSSPGNKRIQFFRKHQRDDEPLADATNDKPLDVSSIINPIHAKSMEYAEKPETKSKPRVKTKRGYGRKNGNKNVNEKENKNNKVFHCLGQIQRV